MNTERILWTSNSPLAGIPFNWINKYGALELYYPMTIRLSKTTGEPIISVVFVRNKYVCTKCFFPTMLQEQQLKELQMRCETISWPTDFTNDDKELFSLFKKCSPEHLKTVCP